MRCDDIVGVPASTYPRVPGVGSPLTPRQVQSDRHPSCPAFQIPVARTHSLALQIWIKLAISLPFDQADTAVRVPDTHNLASNHGLGIQQCPTCVEHHFVALSLNDIAFGCTDDCPSYERPGDAGNIFAFSPATALTRSKAFS